ncbi:MAG: hypothetical protein QF476_07795 [Dehalococcoidia bacterium]|nr:hypothetical protein [Dehalococcoidia bacterium]MDP7485934.1 hypothetical protein [Dehalococcoidia bacterium]
MTVDRILRRRKDRAFDIESNAYQQLLDEGAALARSSGIELFDTTVGSVAKTYKKIQPH